MEPRDYQTAAVKDTWRFLCTTQANPLIVAPTGSGKSWLIAMLAAKAATHQGRILVVAHRKELLQQNAEKLEQLLEQPVGIYSAGLRRRDVTPDVVVAGVQSVYKKAENLGERHLILVDEAHLIATGENTMYRKLISHFPRARLVGLTATPYRTGEGYIIGDDHLFDFISHETHIKPLIERGYLCPLSFTPTTEVDVSNVSVRAGEFVQGEMERAFAETSVAKQACKEIVKFTADRKSILVFCAGVMHAEFVRNELERLTGEQVGCITGHTMAMERSESLRRFRNGEMRIMTNCDCLTTGFDSPRIDCIAVLRATMSPGLYCQILGRGFRIHPEKTDCLVLDFGGNRRRHGSPSDANYGASSVRESEGGEAPVKTCAGCKAQVPIASAACNVCGLEFPLPEMKERHESKPDLEQIIRWDVEEVVVCKHVKRGAAPGHPPTLRVDYNLREEGKSGNLVGTSASEWVCFSHEGFARRKAVAWWQLRSNHPAPVSVDDALDLINRHAIRMPSKLATEVDGKYRRVKHVEFCDEKPEVDDLQPGWVDEVAVDPFGEEVPF